MHPKSQKSPDCHKPEAVSVAESLEAYEPVARLICGQDQAPAWLVAHIARWAPSLMMTWQILERQPTRAELVEQMKAVVKAAQVLREVVGKPAMSEFLVSPPFGVLDVEACQRLLFDLGQRAENVLARPDIVVPSGAVKNGRSRALPPQVTAAKDDCAAFIAEAWLFCRQKPVSSRNKEAAQAAQAFWETAGAKFKHWGEIKSAWRPYFENARQPKMSSFRAEVHRHMTESAELPLSSGLK